MKLALNVLGMLVLGLATLAIFAAVQQWRVEAQTAASRSFGPASAGASQSGKPLDALADGIEASLRVAGEELGRNRGRAVGALDAAKRASDVGGLGFASVHAFVLEARHVLQNGHPARARRLVEEARAALRKVDAQGHGPLGRLERYAGATLIDVRGARIGEVGRAGQRGGKTYVRLSLGGVHHAFGFLDIGGTSISVPADALIFGHPRVLGPTLVAWTGGRG